MNSSYRSLLDALYTLETQGNLSAPLKVRLQTLRLKLRSITAIFNETGKWHVEDEILKALLNRVQSVCNDNCLDLAGLLFTAWVGEEDPLWQMATTMLEKIELLRPDIKEIYTILSKSSRSVAEVTDESVMKHIDSCLENMEGLLQYKAVTVVTLNEELEAARKSLRFLKNLLVFSAGRSSKVARLLLCPHAVRFFWNLLGFVASRSSELNFKDLLVHAATVADNIACLLSLCFINDEMDDQMISWMKLELLSQRRRIYRPEQPEVRKTYINTLEVSNSVPCTTREAEFILGFLDSFRENLFELSEDKHGYNISVKDQMSTLHEDLRFLEYLVFDTSYKDHTDLWRKFKNLCEQKNILMKETAWVIYSLVYDVENKDMFSETLTLFSGVLGKFKVAREEARLIYDQLVPKCLRSNFPSTNAQGYINSFLANLKRLLSSKAISIAPLKHHLESVLDELLLLREDFIKTQQHANEYDHLWARFKDVVYQTECVVDSFPDKDRKIWFHKLGLLDVSEEIRTIKAGLSHVRRKTADQGTAFGKISSIPSRISLQTSPKDELMVFELQYEQIMEHLTTGSEKLQILSIVGMPGMGKTTLANCVFQNSSATHHFRVCASCCVSQEYDRKRLLVKILRDVPVPSTFDYDYTIEDIEHKLYQNLKGRRYLIFLDDIWDICLLKNFRYSFPDDKNGSRIMLTSRFSEIASQAGVESITYHLAPLSDNKSWEMLQFKIFGKESCPQELVKVGKQIAIGCRGLPLTIDLIAGILREIGEKQNYWHQLARYLLRKVVDDPQGRCRKTLEISYNHLPNDLRPCFLYFAAFPQDTRIPARRLKLLWITEGFVLPDNNKRSSEEVAETYLDQLISRNLIMVSGRGSMGRVKKTHVHDLLHDFARAKAMEERFLLPIDGLSDFSRLTTKGRLWSEQCRLCIYPRYERNFLLSEPSGPRVRSIVFPHHDIWISGDQLDLSKFRILRVFDLPCAKILDISHSLLQLIHIRYLALGSCKQDVFSEILWHLQSLETLIVYKIIQRLPRKRYMKLSGAHNLPRVDIHRMARLKFLRHFQVPSFTFRCISWKIFDNLQHLSFPHLWLGEGTHDEHLIRQMPNLRKLKCIVSSKSINLKPFPILDFLENLESLTISIRICLPKDFIFSFPPYLKKLTFGNLWSNNVSALGKLKHLEVLKLRSGVSFFKGKWNMEGFGQQFPKLKFLQLHKLNITEWNASVEDFPFLEQLQVIYCLALKELPSCFSDVPTLQRILLISCSKSLEISANKIKENQVELGNEQMVVEAISTRSC